MTNPLPADASSVSSLSLLPPAESSSIVSSTQTVAAKVVREGIYGEFSYDMPDQKYDDARSTFKAAKETKSKKGTRVYDYDDDLKGMLQCPYTCTHIHSFIHSFIHLTLYYTGKYTAILAVLIVGSFVVPMAQYFWYVRDDETTDNFFGSKVEYKEPEQPKKKKGWF